MKTNIPLLVTVYEKRTKKFLFDELKPVQSFTADIPYWMGLDCWGKWNNTYALYNICKLYDISGNIGITYTTEVLKQMDEIKTYLLNNSISKNEQQN